ncbi:hypothetical protein C8F01DRAFT_142233 [Mycena amicta]|nr:hypothetical protein C8F01DRAFT_142233 [Mycena amicta]
MGQNVRHRRQLSVEGRRRVGPGGAGGYAGQWELRVCTKCECENDSRPWVRNGSNTAKPLSYPGVERVVGLDVTEGMVEVAKTREALARGLQEGRLVLGVWDVMGDENVPAFVNAERRADALISTLVLEHLPSLYTFFQRSRRLLRAGAGAWVFITNMHLELGLTGGANFIHDDGERT